MYFHLAYFRWGENKQSGISFHSVVVVRSLLLAPLSPMSVDVEWCGKRTAIKTQWIQFTRRAMLWILVAFQWRNVSNWISVSLGVFCMCNNCNYYLFDSIKCEWMRKNTHTQTNRERRVRIKIATAAITKGLRTGNKANRKNCKSETDWSHTERYRCLHMSRTIGNSKTNGSVEERARCTHRPARTMAIQCAFRTYMNAHNIIMWNMFFEVLTWNRSQTVCISPKIWKQKHGIFMIALG